MGKERTIWSLSRSLSLSSSLSIYLPFAARLCRRFSFVLDSSSASPCLLTASSLLKSEISEEAPASKGLIYLPPTPEPDPVVINLPVSHLREPLDTSPGH